MYDSVKHTVGKKVCVVWKAGSVSNHDVSQVQFLPLYQLRHIAHIQAPELSGWSNEWFLFQHRALVYSVPVRSNAHIPPASLLGRP